MEHSYCTINATSKIISTHCILSISNITYSPLISKSFLVSWQLSWICFINFLDLHDQTVLNKELRSIKERMYIMIYNGLIWWPNLWWQILNFRIRNSITRSACIEFVLSITELRGFRLFFKSYRNYVLLVKSI